MLSETSGKWLTVGLAVYLVSSLLAMAPMSLGAAFCVVSVLAAVGGPLALAHRVRQEWSRPLCRSFFVLCFLLVTACVISMISNRLAPLSYGGRFMETDFSSLGKLWYLFWPLILVPAFRALPEKGRFQALRAWIVAFALLSVLGVIQFFTGWPRPQQIPETRYFHATVFLGHHLSVASIFIFPYFAALEGLRRRETAVHLGLSRPFLAFAVLVGTVTLFLTASRTLWVALPIGLLIWILWNLPRKAAGTLAVGLLLSLAAGSQLSSVQKRMGFAGITTRQELWKANLEFFKERPVFGVGWRLSQGLSGIYFEHRRPGQEYFQGHAHNNLVEMLAGTGLFGALVWLAWCFAVLSMTWLAGGGSSPPSLARGLFCAWVVFQLNGLTQVNFWEGKVTHQMMLMASIALVWATERPERREVS